MPNPITIPSEPHLTALEPITGFFHKADRGSSASIAANGNHLLEPSESKAIVRRYQSSICSEQIEDSTSSARSRTEKIARPKSVVTSLEDPKIATDPVPDHTRGALDRDFHELARAWDDLVHAIGQVVHTLAVTCCCCAPKRKSGTSMGLGVEDPNIYSSMCATQYATPTIVTQCAPSFRFPEQYDRARDATISRPGYFYEPRPLSVAPPLHSGAIDPIHGRADQEMNNMRSTYGKQKITLQGGVPIRPLPNPEEATYVASYEVDELLDLWTNLNQESRTPPLSIVGHD